MTEPNYATILLSSRERKAMFRASKYVLDEYPYFNDFADYLCDELDDGGIWNPCFLKIVPSLDGFIGQDSFFAVGCVVKAGITGIPEYNHDLKMIYDRLMYCSKRNNGPKKQTGRRPPFLTDNDYYGPDWPDIREETIHRDDERCKFCKLDRKTHNELYEQDLHVHHKTPLKEFGSYEEANELDNLVTVCARCHRAMSS